MNRSTCGRTHSSSGARISSAALVALIVLACCASAVAVARAESPARARQSIRFAFTQLKSGLRHNDGELACSRMSLPLRQQLLGEVARKTGAAGVGCVDTMGVYGRTTYEQIGPVRVLSIDVRHTRAWARSSGGGLMCFIRDGERWKLGVARECSGP